MTKPYLIGIATHMQTEQPSSKFWTSISTFLAGCADLPPEDKLSELADLIANAYYDDIVNGRLGTILTPDPSDPRILKDPHE